MSKDCKKTYEEIHKELGKELEQAYLRRETPEEKIPEFDLSFLEEAPEVSVTEEDEIRREKVSDSRKPDRKHRFSRFAKVAAVVIIFLLCTNIFLLGKNSSESYGDKGILHRLYQGVTGLFTDSEEETEASDVEETLEINDEKDLGSASEFLSGLYVPTYMPEEYEFEKLTIEKYKSGDYWASYYYHNNVDQKIIILLGYTLSSERTYDAQGEGALIELNDRKIFSTTDELIAEQCITVYTESCNMEISGEVSRDILVKIGEYMKTN